MGISQINTFSTQQQRQCNASYIDSIVLNWILSLCCRMDKLKILLIHYHGMTHFQLHVKMTGSKGHGTLEWNRVCRGKRNLLFCFLKMYNFIQKMHILHIISSHITYLHILMLRRLSWYILSHVKYIQNESKPGDAKASDPELRNIFTSLTCVTRAASRSGTAARHFPHPGSQFLSLCFTQQHREHREHHNTSRILYYTYII